MIRSFADLERAIRLRRRQIGVPEDSEQIYEAKVTTTTLGLLRSESATAGAGKIVALFADDAGAILVSSSWAGQSATELSVPVHELARHMQTEAGTVFACPEEREKLAYRAHGEVLSLFGQDLWQAPVPLIRL